jgi:hypothetical protein
VDRLFDEALLRRLIVVRIHRKLRFPLMAPRVGLPSMG